MENLQLYLEAEFSAINEQIKELREDFRTFQTQIRDELQQLYGNQSNKSSAIGLLRGQVGAIYILLGSAIAALIGAAVTLLFKQL